MNTFANTNTLIWKNKNCYLKQEMELSKLEIKLLFNVFYKKKSLAKVFHLYQKRQNLFSKQEKEWSKQDIKKGIPLSCL